MTLPVDPWPDPPPALETPHPIDDRPPIGSPEARAAALCWMAARCLERRIHELTKTFEHGAFLMQLTLADNEADRAVVGKMSAAGGRAFMEFLGIGEDGERIACPEGQVG